MRRRLVLCLTASAALAAAGAALTPASGARATPHDALTPTFGVPRVVDPIHSYGEPDIKVGPNGDIYVSGPQGTGVQRSIWNVSRDNGESWRLVQDTSTPANTVS